MPPETLRSVLTRINNSYGRGRVIEIAPIDDDHGTFTRVPFQCRPEIRKYRILRDATSEVVIACGGHSVTVPR